MFALLLAGCSTPSIRVGRNVDGTVEFRSGDGRRMSRFAGEYIDNEGTVKVDTRLKLDLGVTALSF